jgi:hypothetical protein
MIRVWRVADPLGSRNGASIPILLAPPSIRSLEGYAVQAPRPLPQGRLLSPGRAPGLAA